MANTLGVYNPLFYAQEGLIQLEKALGLANRVHMGFDEERRAFGLGDTISIRRPSTFTVADAPVADGSAQDLKTGTVNLQLNYWREVKFGLTDKELAFTKERIIRDHIRPATYALADDIDQKLATLGLKTPHNSKTTGALSSTGAADLATLRKTMFDNSVPVNDLMNMHLMVNSTLEAELLSNAAFAQSQGAADTGERVQTTGRMGPKYGFNVFANQNTAGTYTPGSNTDKVGAVNNAAGYAIDSTSIAVDALEAAVTYKAGDYVTFAGHSKKYALDADFTTSGGAGTMVLAEGLRAAVADDEVITIVEETGGPYANASFGFHRNFAAFASAPLSEMGNELGARIATVQDPITGLSLRSRLYYVGGASKVFVAFDVLFGFKLLDGDLACKFLDAA